MLPLNIAELHKGVFTVRRAVGWMKTGMAVMYFFLICIRRLKPGPSPRKGQRTHTQIDRQAEAGFI